MTFRLTISRLRRKQILVAASTMSLYTSAMVRGADRTFDNGGGESIWNIDTNWNPNFIPTATDTAFVSDDVADRRLFITNGTILSAASVGTLIVTASSANQFYSLNATGAGFVGGHVATA